MIINKIATITIDAKEAQTLTSALLNKIEKLSHCNCSECLNTNISTRAKEILNLYNMAYRLSKIPEHSGIETPSLQQIENTLKETYQGNI